MIAALKNYLMGIPLRRKPDVIIGGRKNPYMYRWYLIPKNPIVGIYLHRFFRSDDDRAHHDHPWLNASLLVDNTYIEHRILQGGINQRIQRFVGDLVIRLSGKIAHRIELVNGPCTTLFIVGPKYREWGFHCPNIGWVHWRLFTKSNDPGDIGKGCNQ